MSEPIKVGDLVVVVRPCPFCGDTRDIGDIFVAGPIGQAIGEMVCCGKGEFHRETITLTAHDEGVPLRLLKRIPPLGELDDVKRDEEITA